jgi:hypothetical protein
MLKRLQQLVRRRIRTKKSLVDEFIRERRREAAKENREMHEWMDNAKK